MIKAGTGCAAAWSRMRLPGNLSTHALLPLICGASCALSESGALHAQSRPNPLAPDFILEGSGRNIDTIAFWHSGGPGRDLMFVTAKANSLVEVWAAPYRAEDELPPLRHDVFGTSPVNGVAVDQVAGRLYVTVGEPESIVAVFTWPGLQFEGTVLEGVALGHEPGITLYEDIDRTRIYVTSDSNQSIYVLDSADRGILLVRGLDRQIETLVADQAHGVVYIPDENGRTGIYAHTRTLEMYRREGTNRFGNDRFEADAEGILIYRCTRSGQDSGQGFIVVADQRDAQTEFEFFDRVTWAYLGGLRISGVSNTDGIASSQELLPGHPLGVFVAVDDDSRLVGVGWQRALDAMNLACAD